MNDHHFLKKVLLLSVLWINSAVASFATSINNPVVRVYQIENLSRHMVCSATLMRNPFKSDECSLVTNAHCISSLNDKILLSSDPGQVSKSVTAFFQPFFSPTGVKVLRTNPGYDLAELSVPVTLQNEICLDLPEVENNNYQEIDLRSVDKNKPNATKIILSYASLGYNEKKSTVHFTDDVDWSVGRGYSELFREITSLPSLSYFYHFTNLQILNGMSGGATIDEQGQFIGINVRLIPYRDDSFVIPVKDVVQFLSFSTDTATSQVTGSNGSKNAGGNSGSNAGDENETQELDGPLSSLREPDEGVTINMSSISKRLVGIGPFQIDGFDDFRLQQSKNLPHIYRESTDFTKIQKQIFQRLEGEFSLQEKNYFDQNDRYLTRSSDGRWITTKKSSAFLKLKIKRLSDRESLIRIYVSDSKITTSVKDVIYKATMSENLQTITLKNEVDGTIMSCINNNYLKLICHNATEELSFSYSEITHPNVSFRNSKLTSDGRSARYSFGILMRIP